MEQKQWWKAIDSKGRTLDSCTAENKEEAEYMFSRASKMFPEDYADWKETVLGN